MGPVAIPSGDRSRYFAFTTKFTRFGGRMRTDGLGLQIGLDAVGLAGQLFGGGRISGSGNFASRPHFAVHLDNHGYRFNDKFLGYNMNLTVFLHDNRIYGLTKMQASPTSPKDPRSNTTPRGSYLDALNPLSVTLGVANVSFVAQAVDWIPESLFEPAQSPSAQPIPIPRLPQPTSATCPGRW